MVCLEKEIRRGGFMNIECPKTDCTCVYIAEIPNGELEPVYPKERQAEIELTKNENLKREKYYVWRLLEYALAESFGKSISELEFTKHKNGRWSTPFCEFSLSHTDGVIAVAISSKAVGVDVEAVKPRHNDKTAQKIMTDEEYNKYLILPKSEREDLFFSVWTRKEAVFKSLHLDYFAPSEEYGDSELTVKTESFLIEGIKTVVSVASRDKDVKFFNICLKK